MFVGLSRVSVVDGGSGVKARVLELELGLEWGSQIDRQTDRHDPALPL